jgi:hypothetical protein
VTRHTFKDFHANACIGAAITNSANVESKNLSVLVATDLVRHVDGVAFRVHEKALFTRQRAFNGNLQKPCSKRCVSLVAHIFFATKCATIGYEFNGYLLIRKAKKVRNVIAVIPNTLAAGIYV